MSSKQPDEPAMTPDERLRSLKSDAAAMMDELAELTKRLADAGKAKAGEVGAETIADIQQQMGRIQQRLGTFSAEGQKTLADLDRTVRANPYVYILAALGLGWLLGKARRP